MNRTTPLWESAYLCFETPAQEIHKFRKRLIGFGAQNWSRDLKILELFCGRGGGLEAWFSLGFSQLKGVDLSPHLVEQVDKRFDAIVGDARSLPFEESTFDVVSIHGGLHHLPQLDSDLKCVLQECRRVLARGGRLVLVEPWLTPFLRVVHVCCRRKLLRRLWSRLDALATMIELERETYFAWLSQPELVLSVINEVFPEADLRFKWGKFCCLARSH